MQPTPNVAVNILRETPPFRNVSLRILRDLVERGESAALPEGASGGGLRRRRIHAGRLPRRGSRLSKDPDGHDYERVLKRGSLVWPALQPGAEREPEPEAEPEPKPKRKFPPNRRFSARSMTVGTQFISFTRETLINVLDDVPVLAASLDPTTSSPEVNEVIRKALDLTRDGSNHAILLCRDENAPEGLLDALEPLAHLLADAFARQFREPAEVVTFEETERFTTVVAYQAGGEPLPTIRERSLEPFSALQFVEASARLRHVICVEPPNGLRHEGIVKRGPYHRVLYVTDRLPKVVPPDLLRLLHADLVDEDTAYFSSFVASILLPKLKPAPKTDGGITDVVRSTLATNGHPFETRRYDLDGDAPRNHDEALSQRIDRDSCRLRYETDALVEEWRAWSVDAYDDAVAAGSFARRIFPNFSGYEATSDRWARAVTNRRVGIATERRRRRELSARSGAALARRKTTCRSTSSVASAVARSSRRTTAPKATGAHEGGDASAPA